VLSTDATRSAAQPNAPVVHLREVELACYLRTRPILGRRGENEIVFGDLALWGEPCSWDSPACCARNCWRGKSQCRGDRPCAGPGKDKRTLISVRVLACEGGRRHRRFMPWELAKTERRASRWRGAIIGDRARWNGKSEASLVAQLSQAVAGLAGEIAAGLAKK
jgi:hypothetical protein